MLHSHAIPFLHQNQPSRESNFCGKVNDWWTEMPLLMLNFLLKTRQNSDARICAHRQRNEKNVHLQPPARAVAVMLFTANGDGIIKNAPIPFAERVGVWLLNGLDCGYRWDNGGLKPSTHRAAAAKRTPSARRSAARRRTDRPIAVAIGPVFAHLLASIFATEKI